MGIREQQENIIDVLEKMDGSGAKFSDDKWGAQPCDGENGSGGATRVLQGGDVIEKGACSLTIIRNGKLSAERADAMRSRQFVKVKAGDAYSAAALSIVLHARSPFVPTFRSDVRIFLVHG